MYYVYYVYIHTYIERERGLGAARVLGLRLFRELQEVGHGSWTCVNNDNNNNRSSSSSNNNNNSSSNINSNNNTNNNNNNNELM